MTPPILPKSKHLRRARRIRRCAVVLLCIAFAIPPQRAAAKSHNHKVTGVYPTRNGQLLRALGERSQATYWIDGYEMSASMQTQICWHSAVLHFGYILNRDAQPIAASNASAPCPPAPPGAWGNRAWLQYAGVQEYRDFFKPELKVVATRIDIWNSRADEIAPGPAGQAPCASPSPQELHYPNEDPIHVVCDAKVSAYLEHLLKSLLKEPAPVTDAQTPEQHPPVFYVVKPFKVRHNYDFEAIDGTLGPIVVDGYPDYKHPSARSAVRQIVYTPDGAMLIPDTALARLTNEAQCAALLSYSLATTDQHLSDRLFRVQRFKVKAWSSNKGGGNNLIYTGQFILRLNEQVLRLGIRRMLLAGYDMRAAPLAWAIATGKRVQNPAEPGNNMPWYAEYGFNTISRLYPSVDYSKLTRGEAEYQDFLGELRAADPDAFIGGPKKANP